MIPRRSILGFYSGFALLLFLGLWLVRVAVLSSATGALDLNATFITDFVNDWTAAHLVRMGGLMTLFDEDTYNHAMAGLLGRTPEWHNWSYPPHLLPLLWPFGYVGYFAGLAIWSVAGLLAYRWTMRRASPALPRVWQWLVLVSPASLVTLAHGQTGFFCACFFLGGLYLLPKKPVRAGLLFGLLTLKPHLGVILVPALLILKAWRAIAAAVATTIALIGTSIALYGLGPWQAYLTTTRAAQLALLDRFSGFYTYLMPGPLAAARILGAPLSMAYGIYAVVAVPALVFSLMILKREGTSPRALLGLSLVTLIAVPYAFNYDMAAMTLALAVYLQTREGKARRSDDVFYFLWAAPVFVYFLNMILLPVVPLFLLGGLLVLHKESRRARLAV